MILDHSAAGVLLAGVAFLLLGLSLASESLQKLAANQIRRSLNRLGESGVIGVVAGTILTLLMQSSGALTATLVNLGTARVISLTQVMGVLIGSAIGSAVTVQLISLNVTHIGLPLFVFGFTGSFVTRKRKIKSVFELLLSVGMLFFGLELIGVGSHAFVGVPAFAEAISFLKSNWVAALVFSAFITSVFHSSTATLGIAMGLASSGVISLSESMIWIYGASVGTTSTALFASIRANHIGKQIAWANLLYRAASVVIFIPFASLAVFYVEDLAPTPASRIATIFLLLNLFSATIFFPLRKFGVALIQKLITPEETEKEFGVRFLKRSNYESFALGIAHAKREVLEMGDIVYQMAELSIDVFRDEDPEIPARVRTFDDKVDLLLKEIKLFLIRVSELAPEGMNQSVIDVISVGSDLEGAADTIDHHLLDLAKRKRKAKLEFSPEGWKDLEALHQMAMRATSLAVTHFQTEDPKLAEQLLRLKYEVRELENKSREAHIARLSRDSRENFGSSAIFLETLNTYLQLVELLSRHAQRVLKGSDSKGVSSRSEKQG